ncbi:hypothetical protein NIES2100_43120 [Calothrix sp. NIES-2100]|uniref:hypothetical protein n=1 Tax=Calothrix sp. NIES-2100 TaxID=1954172 RepID=UPI000B61CAEC|nr:hypothetical protein NIES2100_43120 [Calothrix sp. NIES-2100]
MSMKIYDLDHLEPISDDDTVIGGGDLNVTASLNQNRSISVSAMSLSNYNTGKTASSSPGIGTAIGNWRLNWAKAIPLVTPSAVKGISKLLAVASSILKPKVLIPLRGVGNS